MTKNEMDKKSFFQGFTRNIIIVGFVSLFTDLSSQMVFPLIPLYLLSLGAGAWIVGLVEGAAESTASLLKVFSGYWSDRVVRRKPFVFAGYGLSSITKPLFALATSWPFVLIVKVVERVGKGIRTAPRDAIIGESAETNVRGKAYGFHRAMDGIGSVSGAMLAFLLLPLLGFRNIFLLAFFPGIIAVSIALLIKESTIRRRSSKDEIYSFQVSMERLPWNLKLFIVVSSIFALGHFGYAFLLLKAHHIGLANNTAIFLYVMFYIVYTLCIIPMGVLSDRIGRKFVLMAGYLLFGFAAFSLLFISELYPLLGVFVLYGLFFAMVDGVQRAFVVDLAPVDLKATALGTFHTAIGLSALPGGIVAGLLWDKVSPEATFIYGLILSLCSLLLFVFVKDKKR